MRTLAYRASCFLVALLAGASAWSQPVRFVGAWALDAGTNRQRTIVLAQDGDALRARFGSSEPEPRLGQAEATLGADGTLTIKSNAGTVVVLSLVDDNTMTGRFIPANGRESSARATRLPAEAATALMAARPASRPAAATAAPVDAVAFLSKSDVEGLAEGKKWKLHRLADGHDIIWDLRSGGRLFGRNLTQNTGDTANWSITDKGELCVKWRGNSTDACVSLARDGDAYKTFAASQAAKPLHTLSIE